MKWITKSHIRSLAQVLIPALLSVAFVACNNKPTPPPVPGNQEDPEIDDPTVPSSMKLFVAGMGEIKHDTTITLHEAELSLSGDLIMEVKGTIEGIEALRVIVTRSDENRRDELCALGTCAPGNGEREQEFNFRVMEHSNTWYAHYIVPDMDNTTYTVNYKFINYSRVINLTVVYGEIE